LTLIGNIVFYLIIEKKITKSLEQYKISYSGIFKEKMDIYKQMLEKLYDLKMRVYHYQFVQNPTDENKVARIMQDFNSFIRFYLINRPFISDPIFESLKELRAELQSCFDDFYKMTQLRGNESLSSEESDKLLENFFKSSSKLRSDSATNPFIALEANIINEMQKELQIISN
jgi:hypothetical protein